MGRQIAARREIVSVICAWSIDLDESGEHCGP
jgi:hypothetical protein